MPQILSDPQPWFILEVAEGARCAKPGLYEWRIDGTGSYIGRYKNIRRSLREYRHNVLHVLNHGAGPRGACEPRRIHKELADAMLKGKRIHLIVLENPAPDRMAVRERQLIRERGNLNGSAR